MSKSQWLYLLSLLSLCRAYAQYEGGYDGEDCTPPIQSVNLSGVALKGFETNFDLYACYRRSYRCPNAMVVFSAHRLECQTTSPSFLQPAVGLIQSEVVNAFSQAEMGSVRESECLSTGGRWRCLDQPPLFQTTD